MNPEEVGVAGTGRPQTGEKDCCGATIAPTRGDTPVGNGVAFRIAAMDCAAEESEIRRALAQVSGVRGLSF